MRQLDLHGIRHSEVDRLVENFLFQYQNEMPLEIVCGNSDKMVRLVQTVTDRVGAETHMYRYGTVVIRRWI